MRLMKNIALGAMLAIGAITTMTFTSCKDVCKTVNCQHGGSCSDGNCSCPTGYKGNSCETEVRTTYVGTYKGNGVDNDGNPYSNYSLVFNTAGTSVTSMSLAVLDGNGATQWTVDITLTSNTTFQVVSKTEGTNTYSGSGNLGASTASLTLVRTPLVGSPVTYTFNSMTKQ